MYGVASFVPKLALVPRVCGTPLVVTRVRLYALHAPTMHATLPHTHTHTCVQEKEGDDPSRVGAATNPLLDNGGLSTGIAKLPGERGLG